MMKPGAEVVDSVKKSTTPVDNLLAQDEKRLLLFSQ